MPTSYNPNAGNNPATITLPSDFEEMTAESVNAGLRALGDKAAYALATRAIVAAVNSFTRGQEIEPPAEDEAILSCDRYPGDITADNRWALVFQFKYENNRRVRVYTGALAGYGRLAFTMNAVWNVEDQQWELEDEDGEAAAILWKSEALTVHHVSAGTSPFLHWPSTGGSSDAGSLRAVGEFRYAQSKNRVRTIPVTTAAGMVFYSGADGSVSPATIGDHGYIRFPIRLPPGAVLQKVNILHHIASSAVETFEITRRRATWDPGDPVFPPETVLADVDSDTSTGDHITSITLSAAVERYDELCLRWTPSALLSNNVHAITVEWADQGPTPI